jgi:hypothetical protein
MKIADLRRALNALQRTPEWRLDESKCALRAFDELLCDHDELAIEDFCARAKITLRKSARGAKTAATSASLNELAIGRYVRELDSTKLDAPQFENVLNRIKADRQIRSGEAQEIANRFLGVARAYKTKADTFKAILQRQITDLRKANKMDQIADIF